MASKDLTSFALAGYNGEPNRNLESSACWFAHKVGEYLKRTGRSAPRDVRMGRGYQVHANDMLLAFDQHNAITRVR